MAYTFTYKFHINIIRVPYVNINLKSYAAHFLSHDIGLYIFPLQVMNLIK